MQKSKINEHAWTLICDHGNVPISQVYRPGTIKIIYSKNNNYSSITNDKYHFS